VSPGPSGDRTGNALSRRARPGRATLALTVAIVAAGAVAGQVQAPAASAAVEPSGVVSSYDATGAFLLDGRPAFPIALSNPPPLDGRTPSGADGLDEVVRAGVTMFRVGPLSQPWTKSMIAYAEAWDRAALVRGVHTWVSLGPAAGAGPGSHGDAVLQMVVNALTSGPFAGGLGMWKGVDEPNWGGPPPSALLFAYCRVTSRGRARWCDSEASLDPNHLWVTIEAPRGTPAQLAAYSRVTDVHGVDVYPVSIPAAAPDLHQVGIWTRTLASVTPDHSVWTTLEICSSGSYDRRGDFILPTRVQERYMIYDAIINGARGLSFFGGDNPACWDASDRSTGWNWTFWNSTLQPLIGEISAHAPLGPVLADPGSTRDLVTNDTGTEAISRLAATPTGTQLWVLAAHGAGGSRTVTITGLPAGVRWAAVYPEHRAVRLRGGTLTDRFGPWQVHVYHLSLRTSPAN